jgi:hypothetical protein
MALNAKEMFLNIYQNRLSRYCGRRFGSLYERWFYVDCNLEVVDKILAMMVEMTVNLDGEPVELAPNRKRERERK